MSNLFQTDTTYHGRHRLEDQEDHTPPVPSSSEVWASLVLISLALVFLATFILPAISSLFF